jgi:hypothetical protein
MGRTAGIGDKMELNSEIEINASPETVWKLLTDISRFPEWNPFIRRLHGELKVGQKLVVFIQPSGASGMQFKPAVMKVEPNHELRWLGHLIVPGLFDGEHIFQIESLGNKRVCFHQREIFSGILVPLLKKSLDTDTRRGFNEMNQRLKELAEST